jgi:hypothetical protein
MHRIKKWYSSLIYSKRGQQKSVLYKTSIMGTVFWSVADFEQPTPVLKSYIPFLYSKYMMKINT